MTFTDIISTLESNHMINPLKNGQYEIMIQEQDAVTNKENPRLCAKPELLTWVPYMVATKGDAGILNIPKEYNTSIHHQPKSPLHANITSLKILNTRRHRLERKKIDHPSTRSGRKRTAIK